MVDLSALGPGELVILLVAVGGLVPIAVNYRERSRLFVFVYAFLLVGAFATNFENLVLPDLLNLTEHVVGNMGAGVAFAAAAYLYHERRMGEGDESSAGTGSGTDAVSPEGVADGG